MRTAGSLAIVQEMEKDDDLERDDGGGVNLMTLEGDLKWVNREEEDEGAEETEALKVAAVPEAAITESLSFSQYILLLEIYLSKCFYFIDSFFFNKDWSNFLTTNL